MGTPPEYLAVSVLMFLTGVVGVVVRRNVIVVLMSVELMLNAANLALATFGRFHGQLDGAVAALFVIAAAAAEAAVGLALVVAVFRSRRTVDLDQLNTLKG